MLSKEFFVDQKGTPDKAKGSCEKPDPFVDRDKTVCGEIKR